MMDYRLALSTALGLRPTQAAPVWMLIFILSVGLGTTALAREIPDDRTLLNQKSLSLVVDKISRLLGPREQPVALNRVLGIDQSLAMIRVRHNNRLVLINPHRVLFDRFGFVNTGEYLATTLRVHGDHEADSVVSSNTIHVSEHGYIALTAPGVTTEAVVIAAVSTSPADAEQKILFDFMSDGLIRYAVGESELDQFTGVDGKALAKASSKQKRSEALPGQMLVNARSAAAIQRSVMNTGNVPRARHLVVENGSIRLEGESPLQAMGRQASKPLFHEKPGSEPVRQSLHKEPASAEIPTAMLNPISSSLRDAAPVPAIKSNGLEGASSFRQSQGQRPTVSKKSPANDSAMQKASRADGKSGPKDKTKTQKASPLSRTIQPQSTPWSSMPGGLPEWMKYLPKTEGTENPAIP